jgi:hypothetical protein
MYNKQVTLNMIVLDNDVCNDINNDDVNCVTNASAEGDITCQRGRARQCSKSHMHFKGKSSFLTPSSPQINHQIDMKIGTFDYVQDSTNVQNFIEPPSEVPPRA